MKEVLSFRVDKELKQTFEELCREYKIKKGDWMELYLTQFFNDIIRMQNEQKGLD